MKGSKVFQVVSHSVVETVLEVRAKSAEEAVRLWSAVADEGLPMLDGEVVKTSTRVYAADGSDDAPVLNPEEVEALSNAYFEERMKAWAKAKADAA